MNSIATGMFHQVGRISDRNQSTRFVSPAQFCELLVSRRNLTRSDDRIAKMRGLVDPSLGVRFLVKEEELAKLAE